MDKPWGSGECLVIEKLAFNGLFGAIQYHFFSLSEDFVVSYPHEIGNLSR